MGQRQPVEAAFAALRILALALGWYLLVVIVVSVAARLLRLAALVRVVDVVTVPSVRRLANAAAGLSLVATGYPGLAAAAAAEPPAAETMRRLPDDASTTGAGLPPEPTTASSLMMHRLPDEPVRPPSSQPAPTPGPAQPEAIRSTAPTAPARPTTTPPTTAAPTTAVPAAGATTAGTPGAGAPKASAPPAVAGPTSPGPGSWTVRPGDHFWSVAERVLADAWGRAATDAEVGNYWRSLVDANRSRLSDPANPDLLFPGQPLTVPAPPARPA